MKNNKKKSNILGLNIGTASHRLRISSIPPRNSFFNSEELNSCRSYRNVHTAELVYKSMEKHSPLTTKINTPNRAEFTQ